jgi:hypothetical protein
LLESTRESSAAVGIPVLADVDELIPPPTATATSHSNTPSTPDQVHSPPLDIPSIAVTKAPAPRPVDLPMPHDIEPESSPSDFNPSFDEDLESGQSRGMREVSREDSNLVLSSRRSKAQPSTPQDNADASGSARATSSPPPTQPSPSLPERPKADIPDLLADSAPAMDTKPIEPSSPASIRSDLAVLQEPTIDILSDAKIDDTPTAPEVEPEAEEVDPDTTIRLVGGGGIAGIAAPVEDEDPRTDGETDTDVASITSVTTDSTPQNGGKKHKKTKSGLAGLKKLGNFGALRKRDSGGSAKGTSSPLSTAA